RVDMARSSLGVESGTLGRGSTGQHVLAVDDGSSRRRRRLRRTRHVARHGRRCDRSAEATCRRARVVGRGLRARRRDPTHGSDDRSGARPLRRRQVKDGVAYIALIIAFATFVTAHAGIVAGLAFRTPRWRALVAFFVPPLAPFWAYQEKMRVRSVAWLA